MDYLVYDCKHTLRIFGSYSQVASMKQDEYDQMYRDISDAIAAARTVLMFKYPGMKVEFD